MIVQHFDRRVAAVWVQQVSQKIRLHSEMLVVARPDPLATVGVEQHFGMALGGRRDRRVVIDDRIEF